MACLHSPASPPRRDPVLPSAAPQAGPAEVEAHPPAALVDRRGVDDEGAVRRKLDHVLQRPGGQVDDLEHVAGGRPEPRRPLQDEQRLLCTPWTDLKSA